MFEAGALSKAMQDSKVIPLLFGLELSDLSGPLQQFQALKVDEQGMLDTLKAINSASDSKTDDTTIDQLVPALWTRLQDKLDAIPAKAESEKHMRPQTEIIEDLVSQVRGLNNRMREFDIDALDRSPQRGSSKFYRLHPLMIDEILLESKEWRTGKYSLVMLAGLLRESMPVASEVLLEAHRDLKRATPDQALEISHNLRRTLKMMTGKRWSEMSMHAGKETHMLTMELPHLIDRLIGNSYLGELDREIMTDADISASSG